MASPECRFFLACQFFNAVVVFNSRFYLMNVTLFFFLVYFVAVSPSYGI